MRRLYAFFAFVLLVGCAAYGVTYFVGTRLRTKNQWTWMQREFHLNPAQLARIQALYHAYKPQCTAGCARIQAAKENLDALVRKGLRGSPDYVAAFEKWRDSRRSCNAACYRHMQKVAAVMNPADGRHYLAMMTRHLHSPMPGGFMGSP